MSTNMTNMTSSYVDYGSVTAGEAKRIIPSVEESEQTEKTLHHLNGKVEELRARLERVLLPSLPSGNSALADQKAVTPSASPLTDRLRSFRRLAQNSVETVEDILNRLDV